MMMKMQIMSLKDVDGVDDDIDDDDDDDDEEEEDARQRPTEAACP